MSASLALDPPLGGIAPLPLMALPVRASTPWAIRGAQAALSPTLGAPAMPSAWQVLQVWAYSGGAAVAAAGVAVAVAAAALALAATCVSGLAALASGIGEAP